MTAFKKLLLFIILNLIFFSFLLTILFMTNILLFEQVRSIILGGVITTFNAAIGFISIISGIRKEEKKFVRRVLGGMVIRFVLTLVMVGLALFFLELNRISFIFSILFFYIYYLVFEIIYLIFFQF